MSHTYEADDRVFQKLRASGKKCWDEQSDPLASFDNFLMRPFLEESLATIAAPLEGRSALEIGCGSGPISCYLAGRGLAVRGLDVSPTALEMARQHAAERGLKVQFDSADICNFPEQRERYDVIVDGHCLHYFVLDEDRRKAFAVIYRLLKPGGLFVIETMISHPAFVAGANYRFDAKYVLSIKVEDPAGAVGAFSSDGQWFAPYRRILPMEQVLAELDDAGFVVHFHREVEQQDPRKPMLMQIRAGHRTA